MFASLTLIIFSCTFVTALSASENVSFFGSSIPSPPLIQDPAARIPNNASSLFGSDQRCGNFRRDDGPAGSTDDISGFRLPSALKTVEYFLRIFPVPYGSQEFQAYVEIELKVVNSTCKIHLNMANLTLGRDSIMVNRQSRRGTEILTVKDFRLYPDEQVGVFFLEKPLMQGDIVRLSASYTGELANNSFGLNQILYKQKNGTEKQVLATYFQPVGARRVFPCMDEPDLKAHFTVQVGMMAGEKALSNMRLLETTLGENNTFWAEFEKTPLMSPYLLAFVISDFKTILSNNKIVKVWGRPSVLRHLDYASLMASKALKWFQEYLAVPFPLPKLDLVTFPSYTVPGMENFGLITTSEDSFLTNGKESQKAWVATVTVHEVSHQWVGNLVTPKWWSLYWLSEGFATFLTALALDQLQPELRATHHMLAQNAQYVRKQDHGETAIILDLKDYNPLGKQFKNIPMYFKGASVLRMMSFILGEEVFTKGMRKLFRKYQYKSISDSDLYSVMEDTLTSRSRPTCSGRAFPTSLHNIMDSWTKQRGYPLLTVSRTTDGGVSVSQTIFEEMDASATSSQSPNQTWWIPISIVTSSSSNSASHRIVSCEWLHPTSDPLDLKGVGKEDSWVILNNQQMAYLRVNYDRSLWKEIATQLKRDHSAVHILNRIQLLEDSFYLFNSGFIEAEVPMDMMQYLSEEREFHPLRTAFLYMTGIEVVMRRDPVLYHKLQKVLLSILSPHLNGHFGKTHTEILRRELILDWTCKMRHPTCIQTAVETFEEWKNGFDLDLFPEKATESMLCAAIEAGSTEDWDFVYNKFLITVEEKPRKYLLNALVCTENKTIINWYLEDIMNPAHNLTYEDALNIYTSMSYSLKWNMVVWKYLNSNWKRLSERFWFKKRLTNEAGATNCFFIVQQAFASWAGRVVALMTYFFLVCRFGKAPIPLVTTSYDLQQVKMILSTKFQGPSEISEEIVQQFLDSNKKYVRQNERIVNSLSRWLNKNVLLSLLI